MADTSTESSVVIPASEKPPAEPSTKSQTASSEPVKRLVTAEVAAVLAGHPPFLGFFG